MKTFVTQNSKTLFFALILSFSSFMLSYSFGTPTGNLLDIFVRKDGVTTDSQTMGGSLTVQNKIYTSPTTSSDAASSVATKSYVDSKGLTRNMNWCSPSAPCYVGDYDWNTFYPQVVTPYCFGYYSGASGNPGTIVIYTPDNSNAYARYFCRTRNGDTQTLWLYSLKAY